MVLDSNSETRMHQQNTGNERQNKVNKQLKIGETIMSILYNFQKYISYELPLGFYAGQSWQHFSHVTCPFQAFFCEGWWLPQTTKVVKNWVFRFSVSFCPDHNWVFREKFSEFSPKSLSFQNFTAGCTFNEAVGQLVLHKICVILTPWSITVVP